MERNNDGTIRLTERDEVLVALDGVGDLIDEYDAPDDEVPDEVSLWIGVEDFLGESIGENEPTLLRLDVNQSVIVIKGLKKLAVDTARDYDDYPARAQQMLSDVGEPIPEVTHN